MWLKKSLNSSQSIVIIFNFLMCMIEGFNLYFVDKILYTYVYNKNIRMR